MELFVKAVFVLLAMDVFFKIVLLSFQKAFEPSDFARGCDLLIAIGFCGWAAVLIWGS